MALAMKTLGFLDLRSSEGRELSGILRQPKRFALLTYLALDSLGALHRRDTILSVFWPEVPEDRARNALSQGLTYLRRHLPKGTLRTRGAEDVGIEDGWIQVDVNEFDLAWREGRWADALECYQGDFLRGFHLRGALPFDAWACVERHRLKRAASGAAWALAGEQIDRGSVVEALRTGQRALGLSCSDEGHVRSFLEALGKAGNRAAAVHFFQTFRSRLQREFEIDPSPETEKLVEGLRKRMPDIVPKGSGGTGSRMFAGTLSG
jgi:DNA-binding SARP family transcriptional activator